ncbi:MAG: DUF3047 domain-containing protein [Myxococcota bacterium]
MRPLLLLAPALLLASAAAGEEPVQSALGQERTLPAPGLAPWQALAFPRIERQTRYTADDEQGRPVLYAESECSASGLLLPLEDADLAATPRLRWRWRVDESPAPADERSRAGDDFAARVYVSFVFEPEHATLLERARRRLAATLYGETLPGTSLTYVWSAHEPVGAHWPNPFTEASRMRVATSGPAGTWTPVEVDLLEDYERAFGRPAPAPLFLALMTDSDNGCSRARAGYADFRLAPRPSAPR